ncbi:hypothetical protein VTN96DRAFT_3821 [Rasamsonia emersonii]
MAYFPISSFGASIAHLRPRLGLPARLCLEWQLLRHALLVLYATISLTDNIRGYVLASPHRLGCRHVSSLWTLQLSHGAWRMARG